MMDDMRTAMAGRRELLGDEDRWAAVLRHDGDADGAFFYSVRSTGVYCRPSCAARRPRRENVAFHATREDAERAGFRPCKRCRPDQPALAQRHAAAISRACRETGARPLASRRFEVGQWTTRVPVCASRRISSSLSQTQCAR